MPSVRFTACLLWLGSYPTARRLCQRKGPARVSPRAGPLCGRSDVRWNGRHLLKRTGIPDHSPSISPPRVIVNRADSSLGPRRAPGLRGHGPLPPAGMARARPRSHVRVKPADLIPALIIGRRPAHQGHHASAVAKPAVLSLAVDHRYPHGLSPCGSGWPHSPPSMPSGSLGTGPCSACSTGPSGAIWGTADTWASTIVLTVCACSLPA